MDEVTRFQRGQPGEAAQRAREVEFPVALRGYDRHAVDAYVEEMAQLLESLEATQTRETVVQRALDEVGEQTSGILQRAHQTAEEITSRSRAKAEGRLQRAEREAELLRRDADEYAERLIAETRLLWDERQRLIEEMRQLADEVLGVADDATERLSEPEMLRRRESEPVRRGRRAGRRDECDAGAGGARRGRPIRPGGGRGGRTRGGGAVRLGAGRDGSEDATIAAEPPPYEERSTLGSGDRGGRRSVARSGCRDPATGRRAAARRRRSARGRPALERLLARQRRTGPRRSRLRPPRGGRWGTPHV